MKFVPLLIITSLLLFYSCKNENKIIGCWQLEKSTLDINDSTTTKVNFYISDSFSVESIKDQKRYSRHVGTYEINSNYKNLFIYNDKLEKNEYKILKLTDNILEIKQVHGDQYFARYKHIKNY